MLVLYDHLITLDLEVSLLHFYCHLPLKLYFFLGRKDMDVSLLLRNSCEFHIAITNVDFRLSFYLRLKWRLPKFLFLISRYVIPPFLV